MPDDSPRTAELLERRGIEVIRIPYHELHKNGGGIHCSTMELRRDPGVKHWTRPCFSPCPG